MTVMTPVQKHLAQRELVNEMRAYLAPGTGRMDMRAWEFLVEYITRMEWQQQTLIHDEVAEYGT